MKKKIVASLLSLSMLACALASTYIVNATDFEGQEAKYIKLCSSSKLTSNQQTTCKEFNSYLYEKNKELKQEASQAKKEAEDTKDDLAKIADKISQIDTKIESAQSELNYVQDSIDKLKKEVEKQSEQLQERLYSMQTTLNSHIFTTYIFGADTFSDFMSRVINIKEITNYDNELIAQINENLKEVEKQETTLKNLKDSLEADKKEQASLQKTFQAKLTEQNKTIANNNSEAAANQESIETIQKNLAAIQKASNASKVNNVTQATPNKKPSSPSGSQSTQKPSEDQNESNQSNLNQNDEKEDNNNNNENNNNNNQENNNNTTPGDSLTSSEELGLAIANKALSRQGYMYVWGGGHSWSSIQNPNWTQFDCSGLVNWSHYQAGVNLGRIHYTGSLINAGTGISRSELQAGDIILFSSNGQASGVHHVGIYIGNNQMVHAPTTGQPVQVANLSFIYWQNEWYTCRRLY